ncbi:MAG: HAD family hydrolase [Anaerolineae bacterium]
MIKGIIFDLGYTLMGFEGDRSAVERAGAEAMAAWLTSKKRIKLDPAALVETFLAERERGARQAVETGREVTAAESLARSLERLEAPAAARAHLPEALRRFFAPEEAASRVYPDAIETLKVLHGKKLRLGLLSNATDDPLVQRLVNQLYLRPWLSPTFSSAGLTWRKPCPEPFLLIAGRWGLPPSQIAVVGDMLDRDVLGAQNAGMRGIWVRREEYPRNALNRHIRPEATVERLADLSHVLEGW